MVKLSRKIYKSFLDYNLPTFFFQISYLGSHNVYLKGNETIIDCIVPEVYLNPNLEIIFESNLIRNRLINLS